MKLQSKNFCLFLKLLSIVSDVKVMPFQNMSHCFFVSSFFWMCFVWNLVSNAGCILDAFICWQTLFHVIFMLQHTNQHSYFQNKQLECQKSNQKVIFYVSLLIFVLISQIIFKYIWTQFYWNADLVQFRNTTLPDLNWHHNYVFSIIRFLHVSVMVLLSDFEIIADQWRWSICFLLVITLPGKCVFLQIGREMSQV